MMSSTGMRFAVLLSVFAVWCRGTFGIAASEVEIQFFNIHVDEHATKAVITWETNVRTDTTVKYGRTEQYEDQRSNPEQKSETIHSITLEGLTPDTTYHYRIIANDPRRTLKEAKSEDLQFRTSKDDSLDAAAMENAGLVNLTKSYIDKLARMKPEEREKLKASIQKFSAPSGAGRERRVRGYAPPMPMKPQVLALHRPPVQRTPEPSQPRSQPVPAPSPMAPRDQEAPGDDAYDAIRDNAFVMVDKEPLSTFSIDVDTASYALVRKYLTDGQRPPKDSVRIEEMINSFVYAYPAPDEGETLTVHAEVAGCPWKPAHRLLKVGLKGREIPPDKRPAVNLVFLIDVSGSMQGPGRLPLVKQSLALLLPALTAKDNVSMVVYAGSSGLVLPPTPGDRHQTIKEALDRLEAGGSTNGGAGIELAYATAQQTFIKDGTNRVLLCTDGDFNVGISDRDTLVKVVEGKAKGGVFLTILGYGMGNFKDRMVEQLADKGNGNYAYIDGLAEAKKVLVEQVGGTLHTIAKDVKLQLEFNPKQVQAYRLIGYENRLLAAQDFNDDTKDAGELGSGHTVTALYELVPVGLPVPGDAVGAKPSPAPSVDPLRYQKLVPTEAGVVELLQVRLRYKQPKEDKSRLLEFRVGGSDAAFEKAGVDMRFAAAVAGLGMILRDSPYRGDVTMDKVAAMAESALSRDPGGHRKAFLDMVNKARQALK